MNVPGGQRSDVKKADWEAEISMLFKTGIIGWLPHHSPDQETKGFWPQRHHSRGIGMPTCERGLREENGSRILTKDYAKESTNLVITLRGLLRGPVGAVGDR